MSQSRRFALPVLALAAAAVMLSGCQKNLLLVKRSSCPAVAVPFYAGDVTLFTPGDPVALAKALSAWVKDNAEFTFKLGIVDGKVINVAEVQALSTMPGKEELFAKLLFLINAPAQRLATVMAATGRDLAVVINQAVEQSKFTSAGAPAAGSAPAATSVAEASAPEASAAEAPAAAPAPEAVAAPGASAEASAESSKAEDVVPESQGEAAASETPVEGQ